jgi:hypothetical protein
VKLKQYLHWTSDGLRAYRAVRKGNDPSLFARIGHSLGGANWYVFTNDYATTEIQAESYEQARTIIEGLWELEQTH